MSSLLLDLAAVGLAPLTGTLSGVGWLRPGNTVSITIEAIGTLSHPVVAERT